MPMYDAPHSSTKYYIIERTGVPLDERFLHKLGITFLIGEDPSRAKDPVWAREELAFRFDTYTSACHWLLRWRPAGTHRLVYVNEETNEFKYVMDGPAEQERFDERDWKEYHHMNRKLSLIHI